MEEETKEALKRTEAQIQADYIEDPSSFDSLINSTAIKVHLQISLSSTTIS